MRHKQLQRCLLLCFRAVSITLGWNPLTEAFHFHSAAALFCLSLSHLGLMPKDNPFMLSLSISCQVQLKTHLRGQFGVFPVYLGAASVSCCKMLP